MSRQPSGIPDFSRQPLAVDYIDNYAPQLHPAFAEHESKYDPAVGRYVLSPPSTATGGVAMQKPATQGILPTPAGEAEATNGDEAESMLFWNDVFPEAMKRLQDSGVEPEGRKAVGCSIRELADWDQVYKVLERCHMEYIDDKSWAGKIKKGWRSFADNDAATLQNASQLLIPDVEYVSPVKATIDILLDAINRAAETRRQVLESVTELEKKFSTAQQFLKVFPSDDDVLEAAISLVASVLTAVEKMIGFFVKSRARKAISAVFKGENYESGVIGSLEDITNASDELHREATKAGWSESARNWRKAEERHAEVVEAFLKTQGDVQEAREDIREARNEIIDHQDSAKNEILSLISVLEHNKDLQVKQAMEKGIELGWYMRSRIPQSEPECPLTADDIWELFGVFSVEDDDTQFILERQERLPQPERATSESVVLHSQFRAWMVAPISGKLLVEADFTIHHEISALSVVCSTLLQAFRANPRFISLAFFCGLHTDPFDHDSGPRAMLMSLIAQLIIQFPFDLCASSQVDLSWLDWGEDPHIGDLCELFFWLIDQLPSTATVMCILDGIHIYERKGYIEELVEALGCLLDMTLDGFVAATVKILVVSPRRTSEVREEFEDSVLRLLTNSRGGDVNQRMLFHKVKQVH
ncbi:hypothetical protein B0I35DRAFT_439852 [Stachybotrys elegans]|uniref:DUF7708 domain-containing protein n=1 Tax=Stachybotrys elegans TaxID=80388 RepID=A0A8K0SKR5_9HYPO|nr:hypothetical protein B0I35DRAFT_439852 [Stachybotrys elegans]